MPGKRELHTRLSETVAQGLKGRTFASEDDLRAYLSSATFDGGRIHRYVEGWRPDGAGSVADLQRCIEEFPDTLLACLRGMARIERAEKRALRSYLLTAHASASPEALLQAIQAIPETPFFEEVPRFTLPGW
jgi:hypothetical protein